MYGTKTPSQEDDRALYANYSSSFINVGTYLPYKSCWLMSVPCCSVKAWFEVIMIIGLC